MGRILFACLSFIIMGASVSVVAQEPAKAKVTHPAQKPDREVQPKAEPTVDTPSPEEAMRNAITSLSSQIAALNSEIKSLRRASDRHSLALELLLNEERLSKAEEKLDEASQRKTELDGREADILRRQKNIQQEVTMRGFLRRDEGEAILRGEFQRALEDIRNQQQQSQQRIADLQAQVTRLRSLVETLRRRLERLEERDNREEEKEK